MSRRRRRSPIAALVACALAVPAVAPLVVEAPPAVAGGIASAAPVTPNGAVLTADSADLGGLVYEGVVTLPTAAGDLQALELTSTAATLTSLQLRTQCVPVDGPGTGMSTTALTPDGSTSTAEQGVTLLAASVTATVTGTTVTWSPDSPPPAQQLGDTTLVDVTVELAGMSAPTLTLPGLWQATSFCSP